MLYSTFLSGAVLAMLQVRAKPPILPSHETGILTSLQVLPASALPATTAQTSEGAPIPGYGIEEITWNLETTSGATVNLTGTIEQVLQYAEENNIELKHNPDFLDLSSSSLNTENGEIQARAGETLACDVWNQSLARKDAIDQGITYLRGVTGKPGNGPGPNNCGRVSCSYNAAIWWCNDVCLLSRPLTN